MARYSAVIIKYGERKRVSFTLRVLSAIEFVARLQYYGWKVESMKRIVLPYSGVNSPFRALTRG